MYIHCDSLQATTVAVGCKIISTMSSLADQLKQVKLKTADEPTKDFSSPKLAGMYRPCMMRGSKNILQCRGTNIRAYMVWYGMVWCLFIQHQRTSYIAQITHDAEREMHEV